MDNDRLEKTVQRLTDEFMRDEIGLSEAITFAWEDGARAILAEWRKSQDVSYEIEKENLEKWKELKEVQTGRNLGSAG